MHKKGYFITNYIDNLIGCDPSELAKDAFQFLTNLIVKLGLVISQVNYLNLKYVLPAWA